jgi:hypothetical protein
MLSAFHAYPAAQASAKHGGLDITAVITTRHDISARAAADEGSITQLA